MPSTRDLPIDAQTQQRMWYIVKDSFNILLVFVFSVVVPVFGPLAMMWLLVRLGQWFLIRKKHKLILDESIASDSSAPENVQQFVCRFQKAVWPLCVGLIFWPVVMAGIYFYFFGNAPQ
jgi:hypothetical protein